RPARRLFVAKTPAALIALGLLVADEHRVGARPGVGVQARRPHRLLLGPIDRDGAEALKLAAVAGVDERVVWKAARHRERDGPLVLHLWSGRGNFSSAMRGSCSIKPPRPPEVSIRTTSSERSRSAKSACAAFGSLIAATSKPARATRCTI